MITIEDFSKIEIRIGTVLEAEKVEGADKLVRFVFDLGPKSTVIASEAKQSQSGKEIVTSQSPRDDNEKDSGVASAPQNDEKKRDIRQVMSAIAKFYPDPSVLVGKQIAVVTNLEPRKFRGYESQGMIMATDDENGIVLLTGERPVKPGAKIH